MHSECPLCLNNTFQLNKITIKTRQYNFCSNCRLIQLGRKFLISQRKEKERYLLHNNSITNKGYVDYLNRIFNEYIEPYFKAGDSILDFGSGPEPVLSKLLKKHGYKNIYIYDKYFTEDKSVLNKKYSGIIVVEVIEHIFEIRDIIKKLISMLNLNGILIIHSLFHDNINFKNWWYAKDITHITFLSIDTIKKISEIFNLEIIKYSDTAAILKKKL